MSTPLPDSAPAPVPSEAVPLSLVSLRNVCRTFGRGDTAVPALRGVSFEAGKRELIAICGRSGSGKTTLLNIIGGLDTPTSGTVAIAGRDLTGMTERDRLRLRRATVAFVFQSFGLIPMLSAAENVGMPLRIAAAGRRLREDRVHQMLKIVGLAEHAQQRPAELSGGQQQRVAVARALVGSPQLLLADEPTGQLDLETGKQIMRLLQAVVRSEGVTALVATHDAALVDLADRVLRLEDGQLTADERD